MIATLIDKLFGRDRKSQEEESTPIKPKANMRPMTTIMAFAWLAAIGLSFTILSDFLWPILIAAVTFTLLVLILFRARN